MLHVALILLSFLLSVSASHSAVRGPFGNYVESEDDAVMDGGRRTNSKSRAKISGSGDFASPGDGRCVICSSGFKDNKPTAVTLEYNPAGMNSQFQSASKATCVGGTYPATATLYVEDKEGTTQSFEVEKGTEFEVQGPFDSSTYFSFFSTTHEDQLGNPDHLGDCTIHTSCSAPLVQGDQIGPFVVLAGGICDGGGDMGPEEPPMSIFEVIDQTDLMFMASDDLGGRDNLSLGSTGAQEYLINQLEPIAKGLNFDLTGRDAFKQTFSRGTNILAVIEGSELPNEYVIIGAHYDHISMCTDPPTASSTICNGATDNAAGVAIVLGIARSIAEQPRPRRSLVLAFWDAEEDGLRGARNYVSNPLVPLNDTVAYLNWDIAGLNLHPSLRNSSFAIGAETGGEELQAALAGAITDESLGMNPLSLLFGQSRSDNTIFANANIPTVFFSDVTGGCYHTTGDELGIVDFPKLEKEARIGLKLTLDLTNTVNPPSFETGPRMTFDDAVAISDVLNRLNADLELFQFNDQEKVKVAQFLMNQIVAGGSEHFHTGQMATTGFASQSLLGILRNMECDGFLLSS